MRISTIGVDENGDWDFNTLLYDNDAVQLLVRERLRIVKGDNLWDTTAGLDSYELLRASTQKKAQLIMEQIYKVDGVILVRFLGSKLDSTTYNEVLTFEYSTVFDANYLISI